MTMRLFDASQSVARSFHMGGRVVTRHPNEDATTTTNDDQDDDDVDMIATTTTTQRDDAAPRGVSDVKRESGACLGRMIDDSCGLFLPRMTYNE
jgi:hypothetical protein